MIDGSVRQPYDMRVLRPSFRQVLLIGVRALVSWAIVVPLITVVFGVAFWHGAALWTAFSERTTSGMSLPAAQYVAEVTPLLLVAALLIVVFPWGIDWLFPSLVAAAAVLGFIYWHLPPPPTPVLPEVGRDMIVDFFNWRVDPSLQSLYFAVLALVLARRSYAALGWSKPRRSGTTAHRKPWSPAAVFEGRLKPATVGWTALAALHVAIAQITLLWSLLILRSAVDGSRLVDQYTLHMVASGFAAYAPVLVVATAVMCSPHGTGDLRILQCGLLLTMVFGVLPLPWRGPQWPGDLAASLTKYLLLGESCWTALAGFGALIVILQATRRVYRWS